MPKMKTKIFYEKLHAAAKDWANTKRLSKMRDRKTFNRNRKFPVKSGAKLSYAMHCYHIDILIFLD
jgi:hypothetical protein